MTSKRRQFAEVVPLNAFEHAILGTRVLDSGAVASFLWVRPVYRHSRGKSRGMQLFPPRDACGHLFPCRTLAVVLDELERGS